MREIKGITLTKVLLFTLITTLFGSTAQAAFIPLDMQHYGYSFQTKIYRGELSVAQASYFMDAVIYDGADIGLDGVFSGLDIDFVAWNFSDTPTATDPWIVPQESSDTYVLPGSIINETTSTFQPTAAHPGKLFGLNPDDSIDFATATLDNGDAFFETDPIDPDTSSGYVCLGEGGILSARFPLTTLDENSSIYLFVGITALCESDFAVYVGVCHTPEPATLAILGLGSLVLLRRSKR
ncbi:MAG: PEP-CTERM sorting domain-containing protein [Sedimentisphaerales bacterium]|nr:PEP-CTERM sorting domain-containing protein [Sedimentisphaerales bacterium]